MSAFVLVALSNPAAGLSDEAVADWYDGEHIPQIRAAVPGVGAVRRYKAADAQPSPDGSVAYRYVTVYEIEADEPGAIVAALGGGLASGAVKQGAVLDPVSTVVAVYESA
jgi:hypothetical protein